MAASSVKNRYIQYEAINHSAGDKSPFQLDAAG
jgi:hypothetical protein